MCRLERRVASISRKLGVWALQLHGGGTAYGRFVVDATGRAAILARRLGARQVRVDALVGIVARLEEADIAKYATLVAAAPGGWWYVGPGADGAPYAIFFTDVDLPQYDMARDAGGGVRLLREATPFGCANLSSSRRVFAAFSTYLDPCCGDGWLAVGDAAASVDPLSSSGLANALRGATAAASAIIEAGNIEAYRGQVASTFLGYATDRVSVYGRERRWAGHAFWRRRAQPVDRLAHG